MNLVCPVIMWPQSWGGKEAMFASVSALWCLGGSHSGVLRAWDGKDERKRKWDGQWSLECSEARAGTYFGSGGRRRFLLPWGKIPARHQLRIQEGLCLLSNAPERLASSLQVLGWAPLWGMTELFHKLQQDGLEPSQSIQPSAKTPELLASSQMPLIAFPCPTRPFSLHPHTQPMLPPLFPKRLPRFSNVQFIFVSRTSFVAPCSSHFSFDLPHTVVPSAQISEREQTQQFP